MSESILAEMLSVIQQQGEECGLCPPARLRIVLTLTPEQESAMMRSLAKAISADFVLGPFTGTEKPNAG
jgi:hypothetical protein